MNNNTQSNTKLDKKAYAKKWREENKEKIKQDRKEYNLKNRDTINQKLKEYYLKNQEIIKQKRREYRSSKSKNKRPVKQNVPKDKESTRKHRNFIRKIKLKEDPQYKFIHYTRNRIGRTLKNKTKCAKTKDLLGCTIEKAVKHIESLFKEGMTWDNWSSKGWHLDHIKPIASFDQSDPEQQKACWHYTNLQPLWWWENLSKGAKKWGEVDEKPSITRSASSPHPRPLAL